MQPLGILALFCFAGHDRVGIVMELRAQPMIYMYYGRGPAY